MRVIITGGTGLIGGHLTRELLQDGHEVIVLSRSPERQRAELPAGTQIVQWDARTAQGWGHLADGAGAIVNLAGANLSDKPWAEARRRVIIASRVNAGQAVVAAVRQAKVKPQVVVQSSAVGYYGTSGGQPLTESSPPGEGFQPQVCQAWEASTLPVEELGVRRVVTRSGIVLSTEGGALPRMLLPFRLFAGGPLGSGSQWYSWIHIQDEVRAVRFLIEHPQAQGVYNLTSPEPATNREFARAIGEVMGRPSFIPAPAFAIKLVFGKMSEIVLEGQRVLPERLLAAGFEFHYPRLEAALKDLLR